MERTVSTHSRCCSRPAKRNGLSAFGRADSRRNHDALHRRPRNHCQRADLGALSLGAARRKLTHASRRPLATGDREYLARVVKEVLRLYPPAWIIGRESLHDVTLIDGSFIAAKTPSSRRRCSYIAGRTTFRIPMRFDPDRWLGPDPPPFSYVPFGGGARRCIGEEFALRETTIVLEALGLRFRFTLAPGAPVRIAPLVTLRPAGPVMMRPIPRTIEEAATLS